jgi:hypothetical protein
MIEMALRSAKYESPRERSRLDMSPDFPVGRERVT